MAALISAYAGYLLLTFLPPVLWLLFYLREDRKHPEPKHLLIAVFFGGIGAAFLSIVVELFLLGDLTELKNGLLTDFLPGIFRNPFAVFLVIAFVEEYAKYFAVKKLVVGREEFDEPIDAMIYMMTAALGFAAIENFLFAHKVFFVDFASGVALTANRFIGANLLHALSSGIIGYFLAHSFFAPYRRHFIAAGVILASVLHAFFNYFIIIREATPQALNFLIFLLFMMAFAVFIEFERLKRDNPADRE